MKHMLVLMSILLLGLIASAQETKNQNKFSDTTLRIAKLPNGFTYYLKKNTEPTGHAEFYLVNKVGSILEEDSERGFAHFIEHMAFQGTKNYPKGELVDYLERKGIKMGADLNAYTRFDETVYQFPLPTDNAAVIDSGLQILRDWAQDIEMEGTAIEAERGVILDEKRLGENSLWNVQLPNLVNHSPYANRLAIGTDAVLKTFKPDELRAFYKKWYRPELQALVIVGDVDLDEIEKKIHHVFSDLVNPPDAPRRKDHKISLDGRNQILLSNGFGAKEIELRLFLKYPQIALKAEGDFRNRLTIDLFNYMIASRLSKIATSASKRGISFKNVFKGIDAAALELLVDPTNLSYEFRNLITEVERVKQHGFTVLELEAAKAYFQENNELNYKNRNRISSNDLVQDYVKHFLTGESIRTIEYMHQFDSQFLPEITIQEVNEHATLFDFDRNRDIMVNTPLPEVTPPQQVEANLVAWIHQVQSAKINPYEEANKKEVKSLMRLMPVKGRIVKETKNKELGTVEWLLSNGARVILKPTDYENDKILFAALSPGGTSIYEDIDYHSAKNATVLVAQNGFEGISLSELRGSLQGKQIEFSAYIDEMHEGMSGSTASQDLETIMQLIYLDFTAVTWDDEIFKASIQSLKYSSKGRYNNLFTIFQDTTAAILGGHHYRRIPPSGDDFDRISGDRTFEIFKDRFADASDFTFVFTGNVDLNSFKPLIEQYIASLPAIHRIEKGRDLGIRIPKGKLTKIIPEGQDDNATVQLVLSGDYDFEKSNHHNMEALSEILKLRFDARLREKEKGVYGTIVDLNYVNNPIPYYDFKMGFSSKPENVERLIQAMEEEISLLISEGATEDEVLKFKAAYSRNLQASNKTNDFWHNSLVSVYRNEVDPNSIAHLPVDLNQVTKETVFEYARKFLDTENQIYFLFMPKGEN